MIVNDEELRALKAIVGIPYVGLYHTIVVMVVEHRIAGNIFEFHYQLKTSIPGQHENSRMKCLRTRTLAFIWRNIRSWARDHGRVRVCDSGFESEFLNILTCLRKLGLSVPWNFLSMESIFWIQKKNYSSYILVTTLGKLSKQFYSVTLSLSLFSIEFL